jgi:hypothetical protein
MVMAFSLDVPQGPRAAKPAMWWRPPVPDSGNPTARLGAGSISCMKLARRVSTWPLSLNCHWTATMWAGGSAAALTSKAGLTNTARDRTPQTMSTQCAPSGCAAQWTSGRRLSLDCHRCAICRINAGGKRPGADKQTASGHPPARFGAVWACPDGDEASASARAGGLCGSCSWGSFGRAGACG